MTTSKIFIKDFFLSPFWEVCYFPLWWYSRGLKKTALFCRQRIKGGWRVLALSILLKNFFKPMYGQKGLTAYVLSLNTHFWQILWRIFLIVGWFIFWLFVLIVWITLPVLAIGGLVLNVLEV